jgi:hypothetical protein
MRAISIRGGKALATQVYDKILEPVLTAATAASRNKGALAACAAVVEEYYRVGNLSPDKSKPLPDMIKFYSKLIRFSIMKFKKSVPLPPPPPPADLLAGIKTAHHW